MNGAREQARRQLRRELREIGVWPSKQSVEPFLAEHAEEDIKQRIIAGLDGLEPAELIAVERIVNTLQPMD